MRLVPKDIQGALDFYTSHVEPWTDHSTEIGSTPAEVAAYAAKVQAARAAYLAQREAQQSAQSATIALHSAIDALATSCRCIVLQVRSKAATDGNGIYALARLDAPQKGSPIAAPGHPHSLTTELRADGSLKLSWQCDNPKQSTGTMYQIERALGPGKPFTYVAAVGKRTYLDTTLPPGGGGEGQVIYRITPMRSTKKGTVAEFTISFGGANGGTIFQARGKAAA